VSYDLINLVKKLDKVCKNPEHAFGVVKGDPANFFRFHCRFGIKEFAVRDRRHTATARRRASPQAGLCFSRNQIDCDVRGRWSTDPKIKNHSGYLQPVVRRGAGGMLQRPTVLRFPTREYRQRETRGFFVGLVLRRR
jgi:hypothetical protein